MLEIYENPSNERENKIEEPDEERKGYGEYHHYGRGVDQVVAGGPDDSGKFRANLTQKGADLLPHPSYRCPQNPGLPSRITCTAAI